MSEPIFNLTVPVIMSHPHLITPVKFKDKKGKESGEPKYSASFNLEIADNPDINGIKAAAMAVAKEKWPGRDIAADFKDKTFAMPFASGDALTVKRIKKLSDAGKEYAGDADFQKGKLVVKTSSKYPARLSVFENGKILDLTSPELIAQHKAKFYFGVLALGQLKFVAYDGVGANPDGVTAYLNMVLSTNRGEKLSTGGASAAEVFKGYVGTVSDQDPTGGVMDDDIPL